MADDSIAPPSNSGGLKYAALGLLLLLAAGVMFFFLLPGDTEEQVQAAVDAGAPIERSTSLAGEGFEIVEEVLIDAGHPDAGQPPEKTRTYVPRPDCNGRLDQSAIAAVIGQNRRQVRACYERALKQNNLLQGRVVVQLQIGTSGSVQNVAVGGNLTAQVNQCVRALASGWQFPPPSGGCVRANIPFSFTPRE